MIHRDIQHQLAHLATQMPAVVVTGPRQAGKTTLCRACFADHRYVSLEPLDVREFAVTDPRGFLAQYSPPVILDEVQRAPDLFSYLQVEIDADPEPGRFVLTGSQHFGLSEGISQSLAGRVGVLHLLPLALSEIRRFPEVPDDLWTTVWTGGYPRIYDRSLAPDEWLRDYVTTYVQRDVRQLLNVGNLDAFTTFLQLMAGRTGQELNLSAVGSDAGVSYNTIRAWISVLEASFLVHRLPPWLRNLRKRAVKSPKIHFIDTGLVCHLLRIRTAEQLQTHPLRGAIFESWVASEVLKARLNQGLQADLYYLREDRGSEIDLLIENGREIIGVEVKSGATVASDFLQGLRRFRAELEGQAPDLDVDLRLVYGGDRGQLRSDVAVVPWGDVPKHEWA